jgi:hypothetical protein
MLAEDAKLWKDGGEFPVGSKEAAMGDPRVYEGGCLCGEIRWQASGKALSAMHCHCRQCNKFTGSAFATGVGFRTDAVTWKNEEPSFYQSSQDAKRGFCPRCGSSVSWHYLDEEIWISVGSFDHPEEIQPEAHMMSEKQLPWLKIDDGLPRYPRFPPGDESQDQNL